jgi:hypothetical protein
MKHRLTLDRAKQLELGVIAVALACLAIVA